MPDSGIRVKFRRDIAIRGRWRFPMADASDEGPKEFAQLLDTPDLADTLESDRFRQFLNHPPIVLAVSEMPPSGVIAQSLRQNARADFTVESRAERGTRITIFFPRAAAAPPVE